MFGVIVDGRAVLSHFVRARLGRRPAVHRTVLLVDVEDFSVRERNNRNRLEIRSGLYWALREAFRDARIPWAACHREDRGDAIFVLAPPGIPKAHFVESLPPALVQALARHNDVHPAAERIRLRMALHAGEITFDNHGVAGAAVNLAFRLLNAQPVKAALAGSPGVLALVVSSWFYEEVVRHTTVDGFSPYRPVGILAKETVTVGWVCLPDGSRGDGDRSHA